MSDVSSLANSGRAASLARRQALSQGKSALPPATERSTTGKRGAPPASAVEAAPPAPSPLAVSAPKAVDCGHATCRDAARARRAELSRRGRGDAPPAPPSRPPRLGALDYAPKVADSPTQAGGRITGPSLEPTAKVTGAERGRTQPISGAQYIAADSPGWRAAGRKVGLARTGGGNVVSGTLVRGRSAVTGDESGGGRVTGEADQTLDDDVTPRSDSDFGHSPAAQFRRQADPHGASALGANIGRSAGVFGSRHRDRTPALETSESGQIITGSAVGRSVRVTGDEDGACRDVTGSQYLTPARRQVACGGPHPGFGADGRDDPVTAAKVRVSRTWAGQKVSGVDMEHDPRVTGEAPGSCAVVTGSPYQGPPTAAGWCDPSVVDAVAERLSRRPTRHAVTGDTPIHVDYVTGTARGAERAITGAPYYREAAAMPTEGAGPVAAIDAGFSVRSPQRAAHLGATAPAGRITGAFSIGQDKITGNLEFTHRPRRGPEPAAPAPRDRITGEGRSEGPAITGSAWSKRGGVTGVEGDFASLRNPTRRSGDPAPFANARVFKAEPRRDEPKTLVTGMFGFASGASARVTLSGGAQG